MNKDKIKRFNFEKKPISPTFIMGLTKGIISFPDLRKCKAKLTKVGMEEIEGKPYLLLVTHSSMVDLHLVKNMKYCVGLYLLFAGLSRQDGAAPRGAGSCA